MATDMTVSKTILQQLGGQRFIVMTGSKNFIGSNDGLSFKVGTNPKKVTHIRITLTPMDEYKIETMKVRGTNVTTLETADGVGVENLQDVFTSMTDLYTHL